jgi:phosphosulfolactate synthase
VTEVSKAAAFAMPERSRKPRKRGLTSVIDFGPDGFGWTGERGVADLLDCASDYIDFAKIYAMNALLLPEDVVRRIVRLYRDAGITCYSGGILFEFAYQRGEVDAFVAHLDKIGLNALEISENYVSLPDAERRAFIDRFKARGLTVIYEFGRKNPHHALRLDELEAVVSGMVRQGIEHVILEQSEIDLAAASAPDQLTGLSQRPWFEHILIEADPYRFPKQHVELLQTFGADVSLANVAAGQALRLEGLRRGVGRAVGYSMFGSEGPIA